MLLSSTELVCDTTFVKENMSPEDYRQAKRDKNFIKKICNFFNAFLSKNEKQIAATYQDLYKQHHSTRSRPYANLFREFTILNATKIVGSDQTTAIQLISAIGRIKIGDLTFENGIARIFLLESENLPVPRTWKGPSPVHLATSVGNLELLQQFEKHCKELFFSYDLTEEKTPLLIASELKVHDAQEYDPGMTDERKQKIIDLLFMFSLEDEDELRKKQITLPKTLCTNTFSMATTVNGGFKSKLKPTDHFFLGTFSFWGGTTTSIFELAMKKEDFPIMISILTFQFGHLLGCFAKGKRRKALIQTLLNIFRFDFDNNQNNPLINRVPNFLSILSINHKDLFIEFVQENASELNKYLLNHYQQKIPNSWQCKCLENPPPPLEKEEEDNSSDELSIKVSTEEPEVNNEVDRDISLDNIPLPILEEKPLANEEEKTSTFVIIIIILSIILILAILAYLRWVKFKMSAN